MPLAFPLPGEEGEGSFSTRCCNYLAEILRLCEFLRIFVRFIAPFDEKGVSPKQLNNKLI